MFPQEFFTPIPAPDVYDWEVIPAPADCGEPLVDPTVLSRRIAYDDTYRRWGFPGARCLLRETAAKKLCQAAERLPEGWSVLIFDALRPLSVQKGIYDQYRAQVLRERPGLSDEELEPILDEFVALPVKRLDRPSPHATGGAVDLTLCRDGVPLDMGTGFDDFTALAHTDALERDCPPELETARDHRRLLYHLMASVGLVNYECEWWHFAYGERQWAAVTGSGPIYGFCPECDDL